MKVHSINTPSVVSWCPNRQGSRLFASGTTKDNQTNPTLSLYQFNFLGVSPTTELIHVFEAESHFTSIDWLNHPSQELGYIAAGHQSGQVTIYSPSKKQLVSKSSLHKSPINILSINPNQTAAFLTVSADNDLSVWNVQNLANPTKFYPSGQSKPSQAEITGAAWHRKPEYLSIVATCENSGLTNVLDIKSGRQTHSFADSQYKFPLSDVTFSPNSAFHLATSCSDSRNSVILLWDLRNISSPIKRISGHSSGVSTIIWPESDERLLISAGKDGKIISWNLETSEQLSSVFDNSSPISQLKWSPYMHGSILACNQTSTQLYSFADPTINSKSSFNLPKYHYIPSGIDISFDGRIFQYNENKIKSFIHQEQVAEVNEFVEFVQALEEQNLKEFVEKKKENAENEVEKNTWSLISISMNPDTFKENILNSIGMSKDDLIIPELKLEKNEPENNDEESFNLFSGSKSIEESTNIFSEPPQDDVFGDKFSPFRILPKENDDSIGRVITQALISGNLQAAIDHAFMSERYADAILISSCGSKELFENTRLRYIRKNSSSLTRIVSDIIDNKLENIVRYGKTKEWKQIFAILCNYAKDDFSELSANLGRRLISERSDYSSALICFVAANDFEMIQKCLFKIYETELDADSSSAPIVLLVIEKLCAISGLKSSEVIAPLANSFLQHIIQSGHKEEVIRFINALPQNKQFLDLKSALIGENQKPQPQPKKPQPNLQPKPQNQQITMKEPVRNEPPPSSIYKPTNSNQPTPAPTIPNVDPRQRGPQRNYQPPPPPKVGEQVTGPTFHSVEKPINNNTTPITSFNPINNTPPTFNQPPINNTPPTFNQPPINNTFNFNPNPTPQFTSPPPSLNPTIITPPTFQKVTPPPILPVENKPFNNQPYIEPPPPAQPTINTPPPVKIVLPPKINNNNLPPINSSINENISSIPPQPIQPKSLEGKIEDVPQQFQSLMASINQLINSIESKQELTAAIRKALGDAKSKLTFVYAEFRDEKIPMEVVKILDLFLQKALGGDIIGAGDIKKKAATLYMSKSRNIVLLMANLNSALK